MIRVKLREVLESLQNDAGEKMTYARLAEITGLSQATLESLASRESYNTRLSTIDALCNALRCTPEDILEFRPGESLSDDQER